ncbi:MAG: radical SAM protein, partial [Thermotogaceae bacterium]|nr:radical SAM protein [Thermotogaceae bacterium]
RLLYLHPDHVDDALVDTIISLPKVVDYFDMPVQSGSDKILKRMGRSRNSAELLEMLLGIRQKAPHAILRTTVMVGFPGESEVTFNETLDFVRTVEFDRLGGFVYSREEGTKAFGQRATVGKELATQMLETLMEEQDTISAERLSHFKGKVLTVLLEESGASYTLGRAYNSAPEVDGVVVLKGHNEEGVFLKARITETYEHDMEGVVLDELA